MAEEPETEFFRSLTGDPQRRYEAFPLTLPGHGRVTVHHGEFMMVGTVGHDGDERIGVFCGLEGCKCGCGVPGNTVMFTPSAEHAREVADQLVKFAEQIEAKAADLAAAAFNKAAGK